MTLRAYDRLTFSLLGLLVLALGAIAFGTSGRDAHATHAARGTSEANESAPGDDAISLHDLDLSWRDQTGATRTLLRGDRIAVVTMLYTSCTVSCPRLVADLKRIEGAFGEPERAKVEFVLVSLDPARDTPERLARFAADLHLDPTRWTLLTGDESSVRELAAALRVKYLADASGEIMHTNRIVVVGESGAIVHWQEGVGSGVPATIDAIRRARGHGTH